MTSLKLDDGMNQCGIYFDEKHDESYTATATHRHWVHYTSGPERQSENFAEYTEGNQVTPFLGGKAYFAALLATFKTARKSIYITGWQVNWDAQLAAGTRLVDALLEAAQASPDLHVYIMPWKNPAQVETYAAATERVFAAMNSHLGRPVFHVQRAGSKSGVFFSHHQKCVIIDESVAFVGGIDLAYGRYDDHYGLKADADGRQGLNRYNPCIPSVAKADGYNPMEEYVVPMGKYQVDRDHEELRRARQRQDASVKNVIDVVLKRQRGQSPGPEKACIYLDPAIQPRMPWQDYQVQIEGPAVDDLIKNFVLRWNSYSYRYPRNPLQTLIPELAMPAVPAAKKGTCQVQVLRSASLSMRKDEHKHMPDAAPNPALKQDDILQSMFLLICKAEHYIYIENQFFVSAFGTSSIRPGSELSPVARSLNPSASAWATRILPDEDGPQNPMAEWLGDRIKRAIFSHMVQPFHVCIVLPVCPEGRLDDPTIVAQIHLTRQSLVFGSLSLLNRIRRSLWVKQQLEDQVVPRREWYRRIPELEDQCGTQYETIDFAACDAYVTLLNLRDHDVLKGQAVTEQIYVHSKLMIVDDRYVLVGSANINDRSLMGDRDSELAVLISDTAHGCADIDGSGTPAPYRNFARDLRRQAWAKWLGSAAAECAEVMDKPALQTGWNKLQVLAKKNTEIYESLFDFIPKDFVSNNTLAEEVAYASGSSMEMDKPIPASVWPIMASNTKTKPADGEKMPFDERFWGEDAVRNSENPDKIKGYFTLLPIRWSEEENNLIPYNMRLIANNNPQNDDSVKLAENSKKNNSDGSWA